MLSEYPPEKLRRLRLRALLSDADVHRLTGISRHTLWRIENHKSRPQTRTLNKLLSVYAIAIRKLERIETAWQKDPPANSKIGVAGNSYPRSQTRV